MAERAHDSEITASALAMGLHELATTYPADDELAVASLTIEHDTGGRHTAHLQATQLDKRTTREGAARAGSSGGPGHPRGTPDAGPYARRTTRTTPPPG
ncbi:hypothetical protein OHA25_59960 (plasmid) [Nonomuraea sp. NBC_00507]|uniref:hypothetical protein n=1 Tax=Nonomuraea sp. NBC_00507 TaxID=2976002 RepID=UPI002E189889